MASTSQTPIRDFFVAGGAPAWIQAFCAVGLLVLGGLAYDSWKHQEQAKRAAQIAEDIMASVLSAMSCLESDVVYITDLVPSDQEIDRIVARAKATIAKCDSDFGKVANNVNQAYRLGPKAIHAMADFSKLLTHRETSVDLLDNLKVLRGEKNIKLDVERSIRRHLSRLAIPDLNDSSPKGYTVEQIEDLKKAWMTEDNSNSILNKHSVAIANSLRPFIRFER